MAAIDSPRRILGERDINKPVSTRLQFNATSPKKSGFLTLNDKSDKMALDMAKSSPALPTHTIHEISPFLASLKSPPSGRKRGIDCLSDIQNGPPRKQTAIDLLHESSGDVSPRPGDEESRHARSGVVQNDASPTSGRTMESTSKCVRRSISPDSSFDATQDSEIVDSQLTNITEPEDTAAHGLPPFPVAALSVPRVATQEDARENAETLRLRLRVAMYKIKTNQTDLPLSQLEIRSSKSNNLARTPLPTSRLAARIIPSRYHSQGKDKDRDANVEIENPNSAPSSPPQFASPVHSNLHISNPSRSDIATPTLPRSRDGIYHLGSRGSPEPGPEVTSSVVKGRAADGLLSLMGGDVPRCS